MDFSNLGVTLFPNPNFLAKNEAPNVRRAPLFISRLKGEGGGSSSFVSREKFRNILKIKKWNIIFKTFWSSCSLI